MGQGPMIACRALPAILENQIMGRYKKDCYMRLHENRDEGIWFQSAPLALLAPIRAFRGRKY